MGHTSRTVTRAAFLVLTGVLGAPVTALATDIEGVQPFSFDLPHIYVQLLDPATGEILKVPADDPEDPDVFVPIQAFYDTGASGTFLSRETAEALGVVPQEHNGSPIEFFDVGIGGYEIFSVAPVLNVKLLDFVPSSTAEQHDPFIETNYVSHHAPNIRSAIRQNYAIPEIGESPVDLYGMPTMLGKVLVMDVSKTNELEFIETTIHNPGSAAIPASSIRVDVHYTELSRFAPVSPAGAPKPTQAHNPFIGTDPLDDVVDANKDIKITFQNISGQKTSVDSWLFDTGGSVSLISSEQAAALGIFRQEFEEGGETVYKLVDEAGNVLPNQFTAGLSGVGSPTSPLGFWLESLTIPNALGEDIVFLNAPVMVADIILTDPDTEEEYILPGVLGMNYFAASFGDEAASATPWQHVVFNEPGGWIGLEFNPDIIPEPGACSMLLVGAFAMLARRRRVRT